jgi:hypothetical protein
MSGPKVVRIVTREEVEAICRREIGYVRAAAEELIRTYKSLGQLSAEIENGISDNFDRLTTLVSAGRYVEVQKQAPEVASFFRSEAERVTREAIVAAEADRRRRRRLSDSATTLIQAFDAAGKVAPAGLSRIVGNSNGADEATLLGMTTEIDRAMRELVSVATPAQTISAEGQGFAARLGSGDATVTLDRWISDNVPAKPDDARIDAALAALDALGEAELANAFHERLNAIRQAPADRRAILTDSLLLEASQEARRVRTVALLRARLVQAAAGLDAIGTTSSKAHADLIRVALGKSDYSAAERLIEEATALSEVEVARVAAGSRRKAVLSGLAFLGYEIREGMATAWVRDGRVVLRKPGATDYGIEIGAPADLSRLQVRLVGSDTPASPRSGERDRDQEVTWCSDVARLEEWVSQAGGALVVERAAAPGTQAVKTVRFSDIVPQQADEIGRQAQGRTMFE